jgi:RNA polymerase sigma-70 factor (ECF subfamily)
MNEDRNKPAMLEANSHDSWSNWIRDHGPRLLLLARQWTRSAADAEDVLQDAFVRFWRHQRGLPGSALALLATSIRRTAIDLARQRARREVRELAAEEMQDREPLFERPLDGAERVAEIEEALRRLPAEQREVLVLKIWHELTFDEIGRVVGCPANTAASRYRYALENLRKQITAASPGTAPATPSHV